MAVYDCFTFFNELELLNARLHILSDAVDKFVIVEADRTFQGAEKPLHFAQNRDRFARFADKIVHVPVSLAPSADPWSLERAQRDAIVRGLSSCAPDDTVIVSDVDEIPRPSRIAAGIAAQPSVCRQGLYYYYINLRLRQRWYGAALMALRYRSWLNGDWLGSAVVRFHDLLAAGGPQAVRDKRHHFSVIQDAGWHWSYLGGVDAVIEKIRSYSHTEANTERIIDRARIERALRDGTDFLGRWYLGYRFETTPLDDTYPAFVRDNQPALAAWIRSD
ncbi:MAG: hypothetical protein JWM87_4924 [Candidatus Eremiobacteraeota bacterium]|nr:hypothetical protein [Candidatus Eremiobacteraeota bacterium]